MSERFDFTKMVLAIISLLFVVFNGERFADMDHRAVLTDGELTALAL